MVGISDFIQVTGMPLSLAKGQLDGWSMLTMHNPNGVFIALEELGYFLTRLLLNSILVVQVGRLALHSFKGFVGWQSLRASAWFLGGRQKDGVDGHRDFVTTVQRISIATESIV